MIHVPNNAQAQVFSFVRQNERDKVFAVLNFCAEPKAVTLYETLYHGVYHEYFSGEAVEFTGATQVTLKPWEYRVYVYSSGM